MLEIEEKFREKDLIVTQKIQIQKNKATEIQKIWGEL